MNNLKILLSAIVIVIFSEESYSQCSFLVQTGYSKPYGLERTQKATTYDLTAVRSNSISGQFCFPYKKNSFCILVTKATLGHRTFKVFPFTDSTVLIGPGLPTDVMTTVIYHYTGLGLGYKYQINDWNSIQVDLHYLLTRKVVFTDAYTYPNPDPKPTRSFSQTYEYTLNKSYNQFDDFHNQLTLRLAYKHRIAKHFDFCLHYTSGLNRFTELGGPSTPFGRSLILHQFASIGIEYYLPKIHLKKFLKRLT